MTRTGDFHVTTGKAALFAASILFVYGVWETFVEQLAIETSSFLAARLDEARIPDAVGELVETETYREDGRFVSRSRSPWQLAVKPGWRVLWAQDVEAVCVGDGGETSWGINSLRGETYEQLAEYCGIDPWSLPSDKAPEKLLTNKLQSKPGLIPTFMSDSQASTLKVAHKSSADQVKHLKALAVKSKPTQPDILRVGIDALVELRNDIAHSATIPENLSNTAAVRWIDFVECLVTKIDEAWRASAREMIGPAA